MSVSSQAFAELRSMDIVDDDLVEIEDGIDDDFYVVKKHVNKNHENNFDKNIQIPKTLPESCDKVVYLYDLLSHSSDDTGAPYGKMWTINCSR